MEGGVEYDAAERQTVKFRLHVWSRCVGPRRRPPTVHSHCMQCGVYSNVTCQPTTVLSRWVVCLVPRLDCFVLVLVQFSLLLNSLSACRSA